MTENKDNILYINDQQYNTDSFDENQKYLVAQVRSCQERANRAKFDYDREKAALDYFLSALISSVESNSKEKLG